MRFAVICVALLLACTAPARPQTPPPSEAETMRDAAFQGAQWIMFTSTAQAVAGVGARLAAGDDDRGALIRSRQQAADTRAAARDALRQALRDGADPAASEAALRLAEADLARIEADLALRFPAYAEFGLPRPLSLAEVQAALQPDEALLLIVTGPSASYVWAVTPDRADWTRSDLGSEALAAAVADLRDDLDPTALVRAAVSLAQPDPDPRGPSFDRALAHQLWQTLIAPVAPVLDGAARVLVVTEGPMSGLPLALLVTAPPDGADDDPAAWATTPWLIRRHALVTLPAVSSLKSLRQGSPAPRTENQRFIGVGAPLLLGPTGGNAVTVAQSAAGISGHMGDPEVLRRLPALPGTARELARIAALFAPADRIVLTGADATETGLAALPLHSATVLHFATHGLVTGELPGLTEPALVLTPPQVASATDDGLLSASDAARLNLQAKWVILSACNTAAGDATGGGSLSGLARAFFVAGARSLMVSHWPVQDDAAARLVSQTVAQVRDDPGLPRAEALRRAMITMIDGGGPMAHPTAWAPFVLVGEGGAGQ